MTEGRQRVTVPEAARLLNTTEGALRKRIERGSLPHEKGLDGRVYVRVDFVETRVDSGETSDQRLIELYEKRIADLREQLAAEREANRENRRIIMQQAQTLAAIEPPESHERHEPPPESAHEGPEEGTPQPEAQEPSSRLLRGLRRWWRSGGG